MIISTATTDGKDMIQCRKELPVGRMSFVHFSDQILAALINKGLQVNIEDGDSMEGSWIGTRDFIAYPSN